MEVLGISGSPVDNSNLDRVIKAILEATELDVGFIKLSHFKITPCRACLKCVPTNRASRRTIGRKSPKGY